MTRAQWIGLFLIVTFAGSGAVIYMKTRGLRNNNPGNIEKGDNWRGMASEQTDSRFITFVKPEYGIRAMARIIKNYKKKYNVNTIYKIIERWAPPIENDTENYAAFVAKQVGVSAHDPISIETYLPSIIAAMIEMENGQQPYAPALIAQGIQLERSA